MVSHVRETQQCNIMDCVLIQPCVPEIKTVSSTAKQLSSDDAAPHQVCVHACHQSERYWWWVTLRMVDYAGCYCISNSRCDFIWKAPLNVSHFPGSYEKVHFLNTALCYTCFDVDYVWLSPCCGSFLLAQLWDACDVRGEFPFLSTSPPSSLNLSPSSFMETPRQVMMRITWVSSTAILALLENRCGVRMVVVSIRAPHLFK